MPGMLNRLASPGGRRAGHQILIFHRVLAAPDPVQPQEPDRAAFDALIGLLKRHYRILPLEQALADLDAGRLPAASLSITFDDGYADNVEVALPVLQSHGVSATFFIATGFLDGGRMFNDSVIEAVRRLPVGDLDLQDLGLGRHRVEAGQRPALIRDLLRAIKHRPQAERQALADAIGERAGGLPNDLMMRSDQVRRLAEAGMSIGGHTHSHPILSCLDDASARAEMAEGRERLQHLSGQTVALFAYPNGRRGQDYDDRHARMARELGFRAALTTNAGVSRVDSDRWQLPRFTPWDRSPLRFLLRLQMNRHGLLH